MSEEIISEEVVEVVAPEPTEGAVEVTPEPVEEAVVEEAV